MIKKLKYKLKLLFGIKMPSKILMEIGEKYLLGLNLGKQKAYLLKATAFKKPYTFNPLELFSNETLETKYNDMKEWFN